MLGYLKPSFKNMPKELKKEYKAYYCGLCHTLKSRYGCLGATCLNYELTLFLIVLNGLYHEKQQLFHGSCSLTPFYPVQYVDYLRKEFVKASDLSIIIANYEVLDNIHDDGSIKWKMANILLSNATRKSRDSLALDLLKIDEIIKNYYIEEFSDNTSFYKVVDLSGEMIKNIIFPLFEDFEDRIKFAIAELAELIGQWIYLIDACDDKYTDEVKNKFNPLTLLEDQKNICGIIKSIEMKIAVTIKQLPLFNYQRLIEFILVDSLSQKSNQIIKSLKLNDENT